MSKLKANKADLRVSLRKKMITLAAKTSTHYPHIGSCLSCIDILIQVMIYEMSPADKFMLSKGHAALALYVVLSRLGKIPKKVLEKTYFQEGTQFGLHTPSSLKEDRLPPRDP